MLTAKKFFICLIFFAGAFHAGAQVKFQRTFGIGLYNEGRCVKQTIDGGYIVAGTASDAGAGSADFYLLKTDSTGNFQWHRVYGGSNIDRAYSVLQASDGGYVVCGYTNSFNTTNNYDGYLLKTDANGDTLWTRVLGGSDWDFIYSMRQTSDGGFILAGNSYSNTNGNSQAWLIKTDSTGNTEWIKSFDFTDDAFIQSVAISPEGGFVLAGYKINSALNDEDILLIKTNSSGDTTWTKTFGNALTNERAYSTDISSTDSSIVVAGYSKDTSSSVQEEGCLVKFNAQGNVLFTQFVVGNGQDVIQDVHFHNDSLFIAGFTTSSGAGHKDAQYFTLNTGGYQYNGHTQGGIGDDVSYHIERTTDGGYILCGSSTSYTPGLQSVYLLKLDSLLQTTSVIIHVDEPGASHRFFSNYPNPFRGYTTIDLSGIRASRKLTFSVFNSLGEKVFYSVNQTSNEIIFFANGLPAGIYLYKVSDAEDILGYGKFLIE